MMSQDTIKEILNSGILAPSGENCQPWHFKVLANKISVYNLPERDASLYSWGQRSSFVAHGALIENIVIAAKEKGLISKINLFPNAGEENLVAEIVLEEGSVEKDPLFKFISLRCTNRKPYNPNNMSAETKSALLGEFDSAGPVKIDIIEDREKISGLAKLTSLNEKVLFENRSLHKFFFNHINWTKAEDEKKSVGFFLDTLELPPPARGMFKLIKHWAVLNVLNKIGFSGVVAKDNEKNHTASAAHVLISIPTDKKEDFVQAGRTLERFWLKAASLGLSVQPLTGIIYLYLKIKAGETGEFSPGQAELIKSVYSKMNESFSFGGRVPAMYLRIGTAPDPSARSSRLPLTTSLS